MCYRCKCAAKVVIILESTKFEKQILCFRPNEANKANEANEAN